MLEVIGVYVQRKQLAYDTMQGPAVWALRAQTDKQEYAVLMRRLLEGTPNLHMREGQATGLDLGPNDEVGMAQACAHCTNIARKGGTQWWRSPVIS